jgi:lipopolysaccharide transport system ATP-binding protein
MNGTNDAVLRIDGLWKQYRIGAQQERYRTLRDVVARSVTDRFRRLTGRAEPAAAESTTIWALEDVSFDVRRGEVVGVIGRNGAGKSTLLKILSRITEPTRGYIDVTGRVSSLLEVGTGFHQELTGRENIYLNATILGMSRQEVNRKFDAIVEFAEVAKFIDTAVKHYSTGMHLRLAFSVAAHLEPDILLVDEVLAVGDAAFQKKCLGKMEDVAAQGRTVLFVSHNLGIVRELCHSCALLDGGKLAFRGPVLDALAIYTGTLRQTPIVDIAAGVAWRGVQIHSDNGTRAKRDSHLTLSGWLALGEPFAGGTLICIVEDSAGNTIVHQRSTAPDGWDCPLEPGMINVAIEFPALWLSPGAYTVYFKFFGKRASGSTESAVSDRVLLDMPGSRVGVSGAILTPPYHWNVRPQAQSVSYADAAGRVV